MDGPPEEPRWSALRIGPGGMPADQVRPIDGNANGADLGGASPQPVSDRTSLLPFADLGRPSAVFGSFDEGKPRRRAAFVWIALAVVGAVVVAAAFWSSDSTTATTSAHLQPGACLTSSGGRAVIPVDCAAPDAEFVVAARHDGTTDSAGCTAVTSDVVLVTRDDVVLCLNYRARVGDCLYAGSATAVGKAPCRTSGSTAIPQGLFRVIAVLSGTLDRRECPSGTIETLVHVGDREVVCLGLP